MLCLWCDSMAKKFHSNYERLAPKFSYETREASAVPWADVPDGNKRLMRATIRATLDCVCSEDEGASHDAPDYRGHR